MRIHDLCTNKHRLLVHTSSAVLLTGPQSRHKEQATKVPQSELREGESEREGGREGGRKEEEEESNLITLKR